MNFKRLRRSDELENVAVFKQSDSYADGSEGAGGACPRHRHTALKKTRFQTRGKDGKPFYCAAPISRTFIHSVYKLVTNRLADVLAKP